VKLGERGELRLRQLLDHARHEDRGVTLHRHAEQEADLRIEGITRRRGRNGLQPAAARP
jgi:hypothetical protein